MTLFVLQRIVQFVCIGLYLIYLNPRKQQRILHGKRTKSFYLSVDSYPNTTPLSYHRFFPHSLQNYVLCATAFAQSWLKKQLWPWESCLRRLK